jgi:hypothetical protein
MPVDYVQKLHHDIYPAIDPKGKLSGAANGKAIVITGAGKGIGEVRSYIVLTEIGHCKGICCCWRKGTCVVIADRVGSGTDSSTRQDNQSRNTGSQCRDGCIRQIERGESIQRSFQKV